MKMIKIILADDHAIVIDGLKAIIKSESDIVAIGEASDGVKVLELIAVGEMPDVVILDINMPNMDGLTCARAIKREYPKIKIIVLTMYSQKSFIDEILHIGIDGCLLKNNSGEELVSAIRRVASGNSYFDQIKTFIVETEEISGFKLSSREIEIIKLIIKGFTSNEIAEKLFIAESTVKTHRKNILGKTNLHNGTQLTQFAIENKIV
uniref:response regulator transcription factor n=1 Tax=Fulvivirga sp. TaxID=1931237 RepID=UPI00404AA160